MRWRETDGNVETHAARYTTLISGNFEITRDGLERQEGGAWLHQSRAAQDFVVAYAIKEIFLTLQGEGVHTGRAAVFCRFSGCNLWSGREADRAAAICAFCDTDFVGTEGPDGGKFTHPEVLADAILASWGTGLSNRAVVLTGGEPLLQVDTPLLAALHARDFWIAVESNGTLPAPAGIDWLCVSPKADAPLVQTAGQELKLAYPQPAAMPDRFAALAFQHFRLQPIDGPDREANTEAAIAYCLTHPQWRLGLQTHKFLGLR